MLRGMVFVDHMNFNIAVKDYYTSIGKDAPYLNYNTMFNGITSLLSNVNYIKTIIFAPKPDEFLMNDISLVKYYGWVKGMRKAKYLDVIEGRYIARPVGEKNQMDINDRKTYYKVEKGTDINLAIHALSKAYNNAYDVAFIVSADTDYISLYKQLKNLGKIVVVVTVSGQSIGQIIPEVDDYISLDNSFFSQHIREPRNKTSEQNENKLTEDYELESLEETVTV